MPNASARPSLALVSLLLAICAGGACGRTPLRNTDPTIRPNDPGTGGEGATPSVGGGGSGAEGGTGGVGGNGGSGAAGGSANVISYADFSFIEAETDVAAAPNGYVAAAWIAVTQTGESVMGYAISTDDGGSWSAPAIAETPDGRVASDPVLAVDAAGSFYLTWIGYYIDGGGNPSDMHVYVSKAATGTTFFGDAVEASDPNANAEFYDKPWIDITAAGTIIVTYASLANQSGYGIVAARSKDGLIWQQSVVAGDPQFEDFRNLAYACSPKNGGRLYTAMLVYDQNGQLGLELAHSDDEGATWAPPLVVTPPGAPVAFDDPNCVADGNQVWISYGLSNDQPDGDSAKSYAIRVAHSSDGGVSIDSEVDVHDAALGGYFMHPQMILEDGLALDLIYYAGQFDEDFRGSLRRSHAPAGPVVSFLPSVVVEQPLFFLQARGHPQWLGDYTGIEWRAGKLYMTYVSNLPTESHVAFASALTP